MTVVLLIQAIVRQTTILIAQLATSGGTRAPLAQVANQVFLDLVRELERQGVSRKVSADMFGLGLRTYQRKIQRFSESSTESGRSLWVAVLDYVQALPQVTRAALLLHFANDDELQVPPLLHDLVESGLLTIAGTGTRITYRATPEDELARLRQTSENVGLDELLWALIYREGPLGIEELARQAIAEPVLGASLERLLEAGRIEQAEDKAQFRARSLVLPLGAAVGWEAAVFDHFKALVSTVIGRLSMDRSVAQLQDRVGGSTYTLDVWPGHPLEDEAYRTLGELREKLGELRQRIEEHNAAQPLPSAYTQVILYLGQCLIRQGSDE